VDWIGGAVVVGALLRLSDSEVGAANALDCTVKTVSEAELVVLDTDADVLKLLTEADEDEDESVTEEVLEADDCKEVDDWDEADVATLVDAVGSTEEVVETGVGIAAPATGITVRCVFWSWGNGERFLIKRLRLG